MTFFGFRQKYYFNMVLVLVFKKNQNKYPYYMTFFGFRRKMSCSVNVCI